MYVAKQKQNTTEKVIWDGNPEGLVRSVGLGNSADYRLLQGIALYEDTYFNLQQIKFLIEELQKIKGEIEDENARKEIESLILFAKEIQLDEHLVFVGD